MNILSSGFHCSFSANLRVFLAFFAFACGSVFASIFYFRFRLLRECFGLSTHNANAARCPYTAPSPLAIATTISISLSDTVECSQAYLEGGRKGRGVADHLPVREAGLNKDVATYL